MTGDQFWSRTGDIFLVFFREKHWGIPGNKLDGRQNIFVGGRARPKYRPSFYTEGGVCNLQN